MSKAEKFIEDYTRNCYNYNSYAQDPIPWLTSDQARRAVEIAREEIYEWLQKVSFDDYKVADEESYRMGYPYDDIDVNRLINNLKQAMKDE